MRILCLTSRLPYPPDRGDRLRAFNFIKHLSRQHDLTLVSFIAEKSELDNLTPLRAYCREVQVVLLSQRRSVVTVAANLWRPEPLQSLYYRSSAMDRLVHDLLVTTPFDTAYVHLFRMAHYLIGKPILYRIVDLTDVISREVALSLPYRQMTSKLVYGIEGPRIEQYECRVAEAFEETWLSTEAERQALAEACPQANIRVVPNGVDWGQFYPTGQPCEADSLIFVGHMQILHNIDAATYLVQEILPLVRHRVPGCRLRIVGADPGPEVQRLAAPPAVTVTGFVPDLNDYLNRAAVFVAPLRFATGIQNKVLEAMGAGTPVVATTSVNAGLNARPGVELLVADDQQTIADHIVALLRQEDLRERIRQAGLQFVRQKYSWDYVVERMNSIEVSLKPNILRS